MTILAESTQFIITDIGLALFVIGIFVFVIAVPLFINDFPKSALLSLAIAISLFVIAFGFQQEPHREIKVTISDDFSATALYDKYTVDDREGEIWTLVEREPMEKQEGES